MKTEVVENFPEYMVFYAVYGESGYGEDGVDDVTDEDIKLYEEWRDRNGYGTCYGTGDAYAEASFSSHPAFGLPCNVIPVVFEVEKGIQSSYHIKSGRDNFDKLKEFERRLSKVIGNPNEEEDLIQYYAGRYDIPEETLDEIADRARIHSSRKISSSQKGFENVAEGTKYDDYHIDTNGMGILNVGNIIEEIEGRGNQAVLTIQTSDGSTNHSQFGSSEWKEYKDSVNNAGNSITDVWITEVEGGSYVRNSRRPIKSTFTPEEKHSIGDIDFYDVDGSRDREGHTFSCGGDLGDCWAGSAWYDSDTKQLHFGNAYFNSHRDMTDEDAKDYFSETISYYLDDGFNGDELVHDFCEGLYSSRQIKSARYIATDPESGEVLGSADTYEEAVNEWGEDVTITDSEAAEGQEDMEGGLFSGRQITSGINDECIGTSKDGRYSVYKNDIDKVYMFAEDGYFTKEVDYDDPELEGVLENWKEIYNIPLKSSKKPETTKQFVTRILSELETGEITEDEASEEIAEANDVNIGYAKQILSNYIADKDRYITSGILELGDALNVEFDPDGNLDSWSVDFATDPEKPAPTLGGELVRAARYIISAFRDNNEKVGWGYAREVLNPAARFIVENTEYKQNDVFEDLLDGQTYDDDAYRQFIDMFETDFADYLRDHEELFHKLNKKSFEENVNDEDEYSSIDYFSVNNEHVDYWFRYEDGQYVCDNVDPVVSQEWNEGDIITAEDFPFDNIDFNKEYGTFDYDDGYIYSWEDGDGESVRISNVEYKYSEFEEGDVLTPDELENLAENGYEFHDTNGNEIRISDIM